MKQMKTMFMTLATQIEKGRYGKIIFKICSNVDSVQIRNFDLLKGWGMEAEKQSNK